jgi:hypothetical protein
MAKLPTYPIFSHSASCLLLFVSEHLCYSWEFNGDPGALVMKRYIGKFSVAGLGHSILITEREFREAAHEKLDEALDYITKMAK